MSTKSVVYQVPQFPLQSSSFQFIDLPGVTRAQCFSGWTMVSDKALFQGLGQHFRDLHLKKFLRGCGRIFQALLHSDWALWGPWGLVRFFLLNQAIWRSGGLCKALIHSEKALWDSWGLSQIPPPETSPLALWKAWLDTWTLIPSPLRL